LIAPFLIFIVADCPKYTKTASLSERCICQYEIGPENKKVPSAKMQMALRYAEDYAHFSCGTDTYIWIISSLCGPVNAETAGYFWI